MFKVILFVILLHIGNVLSNDWELLKENNEVVNYGTKGVFDENNNPPYRGNGAMYYYNNSIWMIAGSEKLGVQYNDVWEYSLELNQYRYHFGPKEASDMGSVSNFTGFKYFGVYNASFWPASRMFPGYEMTSDETFLLFGGMNYVDNPDPQSIYAIKGYGDIWEYNPRENMFRVLKGWNPGEGYREVGTRDVFDDVNSPGKAMMGMRMMKRSDDILFFLYGGISIFYIHVDLWEYNITSNQYRFLFGDYVNGNPDSSTGFPFSKTWYDQRLLGSYPSEYGCESDIYPPGRMIHNAWLYKGYYYLHGGMRYRGTTGVSMRSLSDVWRIQIDNITSTEMQWCWIQGEYGEDLPSIYDHKEFSRKNRLGDAPDGLYFHDFENDYFVVVTFTNENTDQVAWVFNPETFEWKYTSGGLDGSLSSIPFGRGASFYAQIDDHSIVFLSGVYENDQSVTVGLTDVWKYQKKEYDCYGIDADSQYVCNEEGTCLLNDTCQCTEFYTGVDCDDLLANKYFAHKILPFLGVGFGGMILALVLLFCFVCCCCCVAMISAPFLGFLGYKTFKIQMRGMKASKLGNNLDMILREQELLKQGGDGKTPVPSFLIDKDLFEIKSENIILEKMVAEGGGGAVIYLGKWKGKKICYKCFKTQKLCAKESYFEEFEKEVAIIGSISHPNLVQFFGCTLVSPRIGIVLEYCEHGDLQKYIQRSVKGLETKLPLLEKIRILGEISQAMDYLHSRSIIHRDLKTNNVLLTSDNTAKVTDFGLSRGGISGSGSGSGGGHLTKNIGTTFFMAPEIVLKDDYTNKVDVFSMSIIIFEVIFEDFDPYKIGKKGECVELKVANSPNYRPQVPISMKDVKEQGIRWLVKLMSKSWSAFEEERPTFEEINEMIEKNMTIMMKQEETKKNEKQQQVKKEMKKVNYVSNEQNEVSKNEEMNEDDGKDDDNDDDDDDGESTSEVSSDDSD